MRDYDSDTGYRSDQELIKFRKQQQQMFQRHSDNHSEIVPVVSSKGRRRDGYSSDLEGYSRHLVTISYSDNTVKANDATRNATFSNDTYDGNPSKTTTVRNDELYEHSGTETNINHYPSPSPFQRKKIVDQSTPISPVSGKLSFDPLTHVHVRKDGQIDRSDMYNTPDQIVDPQNKYLVSYFVVFVFIIKWN